MEILKTTIDNIGINFNSIKIVHIFVTVFKDSGVSVIQWLPLAKFMVSNQRALIL